MHNKLTINVLHLMKIGVLVFWWQYLAIRNVFNFK
jgi:hypothetical protein